MTLARSFIESGNCNGGERARHLRYHTQTVRIGVT